MGVFIFQEKWESILGEMEVLSSLNCLKRIKEARRDFENSEYYSMEEAFAE